MPVTDMETLALAIGAEPELFSTAPLTVPRGVTVRSATTVSPFTDSLPPPLPVRSVVGSKPSRVKSPMVTYSIRKLPRSAPADEVTA